MRECVWKRDRTYHMGCCRWRRLYRPFPFAPSWIASSPLSRSFCGLKVRGGLVSVMTVFVSTLGVNDLQLDVWPLGNLS